MCICSMFTHDSQLNPDKGSLACKIGPVCFEPPAMPKVVPKLSYHHI